MNLFRSVTFFALAATALSAHADTYIGASGGRNFYITSGFGTATQQIAYAQSVGGVLASIRSADEHRLVATGVNTVTAGEAFHFVYIGLTDAASEGNFVWLDGSPVTYTNWKGGEPNNQSGNEDYVALDADGWNDIPDGFYNARAVYSVSSVPGPFAALPFALMALKRRKRA